MTSLLPAMSMEAPPAPPVPAADPRTGLVLRLSEHDMPATRKAWRHPVAIAYEEGSHDPTAPRNDAMPPGGATSVLLHSCCAPCSGAMARAPRRSYTAAFTFTISPPSARAVFDSH